MKIIIIGGGPAGFYCAERLIKNNPDLSITLFEKEKTPLYSKIRLPDLIAGKVEEPALILKKELPDGIEFHYEEELISLDSVKKTIETEKTDQSKNSYSYDKLILATGAYPFIPPVPGYDLENVFSLRTLEDAKKIRARALRAKSAAIIGGGVLGLELAVALDSLGVKITVIEVMPRLLANILSEEESVELAKKMTEAGIISHVGVSVCELKEKGEGLQVLFKEGGPDAVETDMVLFNTGIRSCIYIGEGDTPVKERAFLVDRRLMTSFGDVYAIGDCAQHDGKVGGLWMSAKSQGEALGDILTGIKEEYDFPPFIPKAKLPFKI